MTGKPLPVSGMGAAGLQLKSESPRIAMKQHLTRSIRVGGNVLQMGRVAGRRL
jgi:hypothetical protein